MQLALRVLLVVSMLRILRILRILLTVLVLLILLRITTHTRYCVLSLESSHKGSGKQPEGPILLGRNGPEEQVTLAIYFMIYTLHCILFTFYFIPHTLYFR